MGILCGLLNLGDLFHMADHLVSDLSEVGLLLFLLQLPHKFIPLDGHFIHFLIKLNYIRGAPS